MGRHSSGRRRTRGYLLAGAVLAVAATLLASGLVARYRAGGAPPRQAGACPRSVRVLTASSFAPVLRALVPGLADGPDCVAVTIRVDDGREAADRVTEPGIDVWIPDDVAWAGAAAPDALAPDGTGGSGTVLATSPIFMVADSATGRRVSAAGGSWLGLARLLDTGSGVRLAVRDPGGSGDGLIAAADVGEAVWLRQGMDASALALSGVLKATRTVTGSGPALPRAGEVGLVPEYALLPALPRLGSDVAILPGTDRTAMLRYAWLPTAGSAHKAALRPLLAALTAPAAARTLASHGLRPADAGDPPPGSAGRLPATTAAPFDVIAPHHMEHVFATWYPPDRRMNLLIVVDVSGSMADPPPGSRTPLIALIRQGCHNVGDLLPDDATLGLWEFGVRLDGPRDYQVVLPSQQLAGSGRQRARAAVDRLAARHTGTGLYDTTLAAYLAVRDSYQAGIPNQVLLFTDGRNEDDPDAITAGQLSARLAAAADPDRPVQLSIVSFGLAADAATLDVALKPVHGYVAPMHTADDVAAAFIHVAAGGLHG